MTKDMTSGSPMKLVLSFCIPLIFGNLFQQFYSMVDAMVVGRFLGTKPLAAVGSTGPVSFVIIGFCLGLCAGFSIPVSQRFGSKDFADLKRFVGNIVVLGVVLSVLMAVLTVALCRPILHLMSTPEDIFEDAYRYIVVILIGIPVIFLYNILSGLLRALGDSRTPVYFLLIASALNIALDLLFVLVIPMGVAGTAVATVIAQGVSGVLCLIFIVKKFPLLHVTREDLRPSRLHIMRLLSMGIPMGLQSSITGLGSVILQTSVNVLGSVAVASITAASKLQGLFCCAFDSLGVTMSTYSGQNVGARKINRLSKGLRSGMIVGSVYSVVALVLVFFFGRSLTLLFIDGGDAGNAQIMNQAYEFLMINLLFYIPLTAVNVFRLFIQGMGYSKLAIFAGVFEMIARGATGLYLVPAFGFIAACFASPIAWLLADAFLIPAYFYVMKRTREGG